MHVGEADLLRGFVSLADRAGQALAAAHNTQHTAAGTKLNEQGEILTAGGRVLGVTATADNLKEAIAKAYEAAEKISFTDLHKRNDIGQRALMEVQA